MQRTAGDRRRRRHLHAVSTLPRTSVALYAAVTPDDDEKTLRAVLREYAAVRDWEASKEVIDRAPGDVPATERPGWHAIRDLVESGLVEGVVTLRPVCEHAPTGGEKLVDWLAERHVFIASVRTCPHTRAEAAR